MVDQPSQLKEDEQYPLLKVEGGGGDSGYSHNSSTVVTTAWGVSCHPKQSWLSRWPEFFSACWMTLILLGISFLVFYAVGMSAYRRQPIIVFKCNNTKPASDVYFHNVIQHGSYIPFALYSDYISSMATQYPSLRLNIIFLVDDSLPTGFHGSKHNRFINKLIPYRPSAAYEIGLENDGKRELKEFQLKHQNVNVSFMPLSKFMGMTPLKYKWRTIPSAYWSFYARVFSVWQNGGVGIDLTTYNNQFNNHQCVDRKVTAILMQHNDGIKPENYANSLDAIEREDENEFLNAFYTIFHQILNETRSFLNKSFYTVTTERSLSPNSPLIRLHRDKRDLANNDAIKNISSMTNMEFENFTNQNITYNNNASFIDLEGTPKFEVIKVVEQNANMSVNRLNELLQPPKTVESNPEIKFTSAANASNVPQMVLFYDFSIISDGLGPSYILPDSAMRPDLIDSPRNLGIPQPIKRFKTTSHVLSIHPDGIFVAASSRLHPLLGHLLTGGCQRMHPKFAIQDALLIQCSGTFKDDAYCHNIYIL